MTTQTIENPSEKKASTENHRGNIPSQAVLAKNLKNSLQGVLEKDKLEATESAFLSTQTAYPANGSVASFIFYFVFQVTVKSGKQFNGKGGGISTPGGGALFGDVYTDDIERLYRDTVSFQFNCTPVYTNLNFFDKHSNFLGSFQSGSVSTVTGTGGGNGSWS